MQEEARQLTRACGVVDTHIDLPGRLHGAMDSVWERTADGDFDYVRAMEGGLRAAFMAVYIPSSLEGTGTARAYADTLIDLMAGLASAHPDRFRLITSPDSLGPAGTVSCALGMENGSGLEGKLENVRYFHARGIRYITLAHAKDNELCDASYDTARRWNGLSPFGADVVREMNRVGMIVDVSHISDSAFAQVIRISRAPVIASHSSCRFFTPGFERNMSDEMIRQLAAQGGVIQINFGSEFVDDEVRHSYDARNAAIKASLTEHGLTRRDSGAAEIVRRYDADHPVRYATVARVADHVDHAVRLAGIDHVGIGSDFEGLGDSLPSGLKDVAQYPNLIAELLRRGYSHDQICKICSGNILRVWRAVEQAADH